MELFRVSDGEIRRRLTSWGVRAIILSTGGDLDDDLCVVDIEKNAIGKIFVGDVISRVDHHNLQFLPVDIGEIFLPLVSGLPQQLGPLVAGDGAWFHVPVSNREASVYACLACWVILTGWLYNIVRTRRCCYRSGNALLAATLVAGSLANLVVILVEIQLSADIGGRVVNLQEQERTTILR